MYPHWTNGFLKEMSSHSHNYIHNTPRVALTRLNNIKWLNTWKSFKIIYELKNYNYIHIIDYYLKFRYKYIIILY